MTHLAPLFQGYPLSRFFPLRALLIKLACHPLLLKNKADLSPRLQCASLLLGFTKSSRNMRRLLILCIKLHISTRGTSVLTLPLCCRHHWGPQKWQIVPKNPPGLPGGKGRACQTASPGPSVSSVLFSIGHSITGSSICNRTDAAY